MTEPPPHDGRIIAASLRHGDRFAEIFDRHAPTIQRYLARRTDPHTAEDILAETFLVAFRRRNSFDHERGDARPWLYGIAAKLLVDHLRREGRYRRLTPVPEPASHDEADEVDDRISAESQQQRLQAGLDRLAPDDREVLTMIAWDELSYAEVAEALAIPVGTVRSRLHRARNQIRRWLADHESLQNVTR